MPVDQNGTATSMSRTSVTALEIGKLGQASLKSAVPVTRRDLAGVLSRLLDKVLAEFREDPESAGPAMLDLQFELAEIKKTSTPEVWSEVASVCHLHPVSGLFWQDPFTAHCYRKPRGYAGDAELLDFLYGLVDAPAGTTPLGRSIFTHMMQQQGALSVRSRGRILAQVIDETAERCSAPRILAIACGHLREAVHSRALMSGRIREFVALDQDADSLAHVNRVYAGKGVRTVNGSVKALLGDKIRFEDFDLVYAAGLYDYLSERIATRFTRVMFDMLAPGGRLLVANFAPTLPEVGYMETFMDWKLIYRTAEEMAKLSGEIPGAEWNSNRLFWDEPGNIVFLDLIKRAVPRPVFEFRDTANHFDVIGRHRSIMDRRLRRMRRALNANLSIGQST
jgi:SAM-dependent methyltransferase